MKSKRVEKLVRVIARCKEDRARALKMEDFFNHLFSKAMLDIKKAMKEAIKDITLMKPK